LAFFISGTPAQKSEPLRHINVNTITANLNSCQCHFRQFFAVNGKNGTSHPEIPRAQSSLGTAAAKVFAYAVADTPIRSKLLNIVYGLVVVAIPSRWASSLIDFA